MSLLTNDAQTRLLFKQFMGVASTALEGSFDTETFNFVPNIFSKDVMIETIPDTPTITINNLDGSGPFNTDDGTILPDLSGGYWLDSSSNYTINSVEESTYFNSTNSTYNGKTYAEIFPDEKIKFFKRLSLVPVDSASNGRVWGSFSDYSGSVISNKNSILEHAIPFKYDDINEGYLPIVRKNNSTPPNTNFQQVFINQFPVYWLMDSGSGYLLFYAKKTDLESNNINASKTLSNGIQDPKYAPTISCFVYNGKLGITNIDVSGQQQVADLSGVLGSIAGVDRMLLPDGSANVLDLCGNDAIRTQYKYVRKNMFIGYPTQPIINNSNVDHSQDPSLNNVVYELDVSGNSLFRGTLDVSGNVDISGTLDVLGKTTLTDVSAIAITTTGNTWIGGDLEVGSNVNIGGNLEVDGLIESIGGSRFVDYKAFFSADISGSIMGSGNEQWFCIANLTNAPNGEMANGLFILDDNTSGLRQTIVFRAGSNYRRGNFIDVLSNNYYGQRITGIKIDSSGNSYYGGANLFIKRGYTTNSTGIYVRVYQNKRKGTSGNVGFWNLTTTPAPNLNLTVAEIDLTFNPGELDSANGRLGGNKATTLNSLIDAELKVTGKTTLTDVSASVLSTTGNISVGGDLNVSGNMTYTAATFNDLSGINLTLTDQLNIKDTYILTKNNTPERYNPVNTLPDLDWYEIAFVDNRNLSPGTNNTVENVTAYFTFTNNRNSGGSTNNTSKQVIHFLAGIFYNQNEPIPFVKVLSNSFNAAGSRIASIAIAGVGSSPNNEVLYLLLGFNGAVGAFMDDCEIRMYKNGQGLQNIDPATSSYSGGGWIMGNKAISANTGPLFDPGIQSLYPAGFNTYLNLPIDTKPIPNAYSTLFETFTKDVDVSGNLMVKSNLTVTGNQTTVVDIEGIDASFNSLNVSGMKVGDISSNDTMLVKTQKHTIETADPSGWFLIAECDDLRNINPSKPNMAYTINNGLFQLNATMNWNTQGYNASNRYNQNILFVLGMGQDDRVNLNVLSQNNAGSGGTQLTFKDLSIYKDTTANKFRLWALYDPDTTLNSQKKIFMTSRLQINNENEGLTDGFQVNWKLLPFNYTSSVVPTGTRLHQYNISKTASPSHLYQTQQLINTNGVTVNGNNIINKASSIPWPPPSMNNAYLFGCYAINQSSPGNYVEIACNGMFKLRAKHSIGGIPYIQEIVFNAVYCFSAVTSSNYNQSHSLNLISHTKTKTLISKIKLYSHIDTGAAPQIGAQSFVKIELDTGITSLNGGIELFSYDNDKNDGTGSVEGLQNHWAINTNFSTGNNPQASWVKREIDLTGTDISSCSMFNTDLLASNNLRLGMKDTSSCLITKDVNVLPFSTYQNLVNLDGDNNLILESKDGGIIINAATNQRNGGLTLINSGETTDQNNYSQPQFKIISLDDNYTNGNYWESKWGMNNSGNMYIYGGKSTSFYSGTGSGTSFAVNLGNSSSNSATKAIDMRDTSMGGSGYPSDWIISLNDNGGTSSRNDISTYINTPNYHIYNTPKNPALHVDSSTDKVIFNAPIEAKNGAGIAGTLDVSNVNVDGTITTDILNFQSGATSQAVFPTDTTITTRGVADNYKTLVADGYQEFAFDTQVISANDWISVAYVGPRGDPPISSTALGNPVGGFYQSQKQRADAEFEFINNMSGCHQTIRLRVSHHFGYGLTLDTVGNVRYSTSNRQIKAFRMAYKRVSGTYDGGILQIQIGPDNSNPQVDLKLRIYQNNNDYGWWCDISGSPSSDNTPLGYNRGSGSTLYVSDQFAHGFNAFPDFFPSATGVLVNERTQNYKATSRGLSTLMYNSDIVANKIYMNDELDMSGNTLNMNGGSISGLTFNSVALNNYSSLDDASGALVSQPIGTLGFATTTPTAPSDNSPFSNMIYRGGPGNNCYVMGSPTQVTFLISWKGNSTGGETFTINSSAGSSTIKAASLLYDSYMYGSTGITKYWYPLARGFYSSVRLENLNTKMEFNNSTGQAIDFSMELWISPNSRHGAYSAMSAGDASNQYATCIDRYTWSLPNGTSTKYFNNNSSGGSWRLKNKIPIASDQGCIGYFDEDDYIGVFFVFRSLLGHTGTITCTPKRNSTTNSGFNRSLVVFNAHLTTELVN